MHVDATFKLNRHGYPVIVVGFSDVMRNFHLLGLFVICDRQESTYVRVFKSLQSTMFWLFRGDLEANAIMGDAETAQWNAIL